MDLTMGVETETSTRSCRHERVSRMPRCRFDWETHDRASCDDESACEGRAKGQCGARSRGTVPWELWLTWGDRSDAQHVVVCGGVAGVDGEVWQSRLRCGGARPWRPSRRATSQSRDLARLALPSSLCASTLLRTVPCSSYGVQLASRPSDPPPGRRAQRVTREHCRPLPPCPPRRPARPPSPRRPSTWHRS